MSPNSLNNEADIAAMAAQIGTYLGGTPTAPIRPVASAVVYAAAGQAAAGIMRGYRLIAREGTVALASAPSKDRIAQKAAEHIASCVSRDQIKGLDIAAWHRWTAREFNRPVEFAVSCDRDAVIPYDPAQMARVMVDCTRVEMRLRALAHPAVMKHVLEGRRPEGSVTEADVRGMVADAVAKADALGAALDGIPPEVAAVLFRVRSSLELANELRRVLPDDAQTRELVSALAAVGQRHEEALVEPFADRRRR